MRDDEETTVAEWYGDTLPDWFHYFMCHPCFEFGVKHIKTTFVDVSWEEGQAPFGFDEDYEAETESVLRGDIE